MNKSHEEKAAARFDKWAESYGEDRLSTWFRHYQQQTLSKLDLQQEHFFLDVGCGTGAGVRAAASIVTEGKSCGIDISPGMIEQARVQPGNRSNVDYKVASSDAIPYPDAHFDRVMCTCSFHHYPDPVKSLMEIRRVLKPDGRFALLESHRDGSLSNWLQDRFRRYFERSHVRYYTRSELSDLLSNAGFTIENRADFNANFEHGKLFTRLTMFTVKP